MPAKSKNNLWIPDNNGVLTSLADIIPDYNDHTLYVATTGNNTTGLGTLAAPYLTLQKAFDSIKANWYGQVTIEIAAGTYTLTTSQILSRSLNCKMLYVHGAGVGAGGTIFSSTANISAIQFLYQLATRIHISNMQVNSTGANAIGIAFIICSNGVLSSVNTAGCQVFVHANCSGTIVAYVCNAYNCANIVYYALETANLTCDTCGGVNNNCGYYADSSIIFRRGCTMTSTTDTGLVYGGKVY